MSNQQAGQAGKGKGSSDDEDGDEPTSTPSQYDEVFEEERLWVVEEQARRNSQGRYEYDNEDQDEDGEAKVECGCCFDEFPFDAMVQCPEGHLFCMACITQLTSTSIIPDFIACPAIGVLACNLPFSASELKRALPGTLYEKWERECQRRAVDAAEVDEMEECPFCDWRCIMTLSFEEQKLFRCENDDGGCGVVSCRKCKKPDHLPDSCEEILENFKPDRRQLVEEAMSQALVRNCPKCKKPFIKELGCNKMPCPYCGTFSCYVCRQEINGYGHFDRVCSVFVVISHLIEVCSSIGEQMQSIR
ncbi:hypothetical protein BDN72DRAFT_775474 [Pluteus cervinus]|uniref:Uncharacterized protein n=1 Tax=Pluteus cervinus TaxID=181527 RepID=A0ACD3AE55_9AGAR|nr:hypothetical protein BDN72DRAFT_775474 [Pluteus cervinus]